MKFLSVYKCPERNSGPTQEEMARMGKLIEDGMKSGSLVAVEGCMKARARSTYPTVCDIAWLMLETLNSRAPRFFLPVIEFNSRQISSSFLRSSFSSVI